MPRTYDADRVVVARHREQMHYLADVKVAGAAEAFEKPLHEITPALRGEGHSAQAACPEPVEAALANRPFRTAALGTSGAMSERLLIAVGEAATDAQQLPFGVRTLIDGASEIMVIAPTLPSRLQWLVSDTDQATERADERLRIVLGHLHELGANAQGRIGSDEPLGALDDAVREFAPGHILIALRPEERAGWQERGLIDAVLVRFGLPVTVFVLADDEHVGRTKAQP